MKNIKLPMIENIGSLPEEITIFKKLVQTVGYCNACTDRDILEIFEINLRSLSLRLCHSCKNKFQVELINMGEG